MVVRLLILLALFPKVLAICPHLESGLHLWSSDNGLPNSELPMKDRDVVIDGMVLLDKSPPEFRSLTISRTGRLVWSPKEQIHLKVKYIHVFGRMDIGSEDCKYQGKAKITLTGKRGEYKIPGFGQKFLGVEAGGTLELHGSSKLSWTKLTKTLPKLTKQTGLLYEHLSTNRANRERYHKGLVMSVLDPSTKRVLKTDTYYLCGEWTNPTKKDIPAFIKDINDIKDGSVVVIAVQLTLKVPTSKIPLDTVFDAIEKMAFGKITGNSVVRSVENEESYAMIAIKGKPSETKETKSIKDTYQPAQQSQLLLNDQSAKVKMSVISHVSNENLKYYSFVHIKMVEMESAYPVLNLVDDVTSWLEGDKVFLTSTDYDMEQLERATVVKCDECNNNQVRIDLEAKYTHFGEIVHNVDMRGEVGILTRNIVIEGEMEQDCPSVNGNCKSYSYDTFGGHVKFLKGFKNVHIQGVELVNMGQQTDLGSYPLHFHMCEDVDRADYPNPPYLKDNSIHDTFARCVTIHGTHGAKVIGNVCLNSLGHSYFLEDGGEKRTVFDGNLGAVTREGSLIPSDRRPSTFWITNPLTVVINNVAAGSKGLGYWYIFPDLPLGPSKDKGFMANKEALSTPFTKFDNNVVHSCERTGIMVDSKVSEDGSICSCTNQYGPRENPLNTKSPYAPTYMDRLTAYKNRRENAWIRGGWIYLRSSSFSDSPIGLTFARSPPREQFLVDSVMLGESTNIGEPTSVYDRSLRDFRYFPRALALPWDKNFPFQGFAVYDGPVYATNVWFGNFKNTENYTMGAVSFKKNNKHWSAPNGMVSNLQFGFDDASEGNRVFGGDASDHGYTDLDGDKGATVIYKDLNQQIVRPGAFYVTDQCKYRSNWKMALCPHKYGKLRLKILSKADHMKTSPVWVRDDIPEVSQTLTAEFVGQSVVILGGSHSYTLHWTKQVPEYFEIRGDGLEKDFPVRYGVCIPRDATFNLYSYAPVRRRYTTDKWTEVSSLQELDKDTVGDRYFFDKSVGLLFLKMISYEPRGPDISATCNGVCPIVRITIKSSDRSVGDCRQAAYPKYKRTSTYSGTLMEFTDILKADSSEPPTTWGAGSTLPFLNRIPVDGGLSEWTAWSECSAVCNGGTQTRRKLCNNPVPRNGGAACSGIMSDSRPCNQFGCYSPWSDWDTCTRKCGGGRQTRTRHCENGRTDCVGDSSEQRMCNILPCIDNFDTLDLDIWEHEVKAENGVFQFFTDSQVNTYTRDGILHIKPTLTSDSYTETFLTTGTLNLYGKCTSANPSECTRDSNEALVNPVQSGSLQSPVEFSMRYGKIEIEAKLPRGDWIRPFISLIPKSDSYGEWPASGQIDIMKSRGNELYKDENGNNVGRNSYEVGLSFHGDNPGENRKSLSETIYVTDSDLSDFWHKYGIEWSNESISFMFDNKVVQTYTPSLDGFSQYSKYKSSKPIAPFDQKFFLRFGVSVGGVGDFPDTYINKNNAKPWTDGDWKTAVSSFWDARDEWYPTWKPTQNNGEDAALKINHVKIWRGS